MATRRIALRTAAALVPGLAELWAERLFLTPPRPRQPEAAIGDLADARFQAVQHRGRVIATWRWGERDAPAVLLAHGWGGRGVQLRAFVAPLLASGHRVVMFDQPAHGLSGGRITSLVDFAAALAAVAEAHPGARGVIAHSLGGAAAALALSRRRFLQRLVLVAPPADLVGYSRRFARWLWMPERVRRGMQRAIEERYGMLWSDLEGTRVAQRLELPVLVVHDRDDRVVPWKQGAAIAQSWPGARLLTTGGLGHSRILQDDAVIEAAVDFVAGGNGHAAPAAPAAPYPAPIF